MSFLGPPAGQFPARFDGSSPSSGRWWADEGRLRVMIPAAMTDESQTLHFALDRNCGILDHTLSHPIRTSLPPFAAPIDRRPSSLAIAALCVHTT